MIDWKIRNIYEWVFRYNCKIKQHHTHLEKAWAVDLSPDICIALQAEKND